MESFLSERLQEMKSEHMLSSHLFQSAPSVLQLTTQEGVTEMLFKVVAIREAFEMASLKVLYYMKDSPKYVSDGDVGFPPFITLAFPHVSDKVTFSF